MPLPLTRTAYIIFLLPAFLLHACTVPEHPPTKEEALALAHKIERSTVNRDPSVLNNIFDEKAIQRRITAEGGLFLNKDLIKGAMDGLRQNQFGKSIINGMDQDGSYKLIKQYEKDGKQHILFRLYGNGSVNYHDYELIKRDETVKAADIFIYLSGENFSKTIADALKMTNENLPKEDLEKLNSVKTIKVLMAQKEYEKANQAYEELPASLKKIKVYQLLHITITINLNNDIYIKALNEYKSLFPNDPNMYLMMVDAYTLEKNYPMALQSVNKLDSLIDKDPYQDYLRGLLYRLMKDTIRSQEYLERLHTNMPTFKKGTIQLMETYLLENKLASAIRLIKQALDSNYLDQKNLTAIYSYHPDLKKLMEEDSLKTLK